MTDAIDARLSDLAQTLAADVPSPPAAVVAEVGSPGDQVLRVMQNYARIAAGASEDAILTGCEHVGRIRAEQLGSIYGLGQS